MRYSLAIALSLGLAVLTGCGSSGSATDDVSPATGNSIDTVGEAGSAGGLPGVPGCPFTEAQVSSLVGQRMKDEGNCLFGDGNGVASVTITMSSADAGQVTYDYQRKLAEETYTRVQDLGKTGYLAVKDIAGEAVVINGKGAYTVILSSFETDPSGYERTLRAIVDALPH
ncbi:hypothetical protein [Amycolatopsis taiwanensis]|uniref:hypothetical protein n=1 Tax=Amycolatopsis taiwanensis TaxID=342230 RepID=UPI0004BCFC13|nr:hypothetical protein [Amycolatopsis taiwanensis]